MKNEFWLNLPVKDVQRSRDFFTAIGFTFADGPGNTATSAALQVGNKNMIVMLFEQSQFAGFTNHAVTDTSKSHEVLFSLGADSRDEVDELLAKVKVAGGTIVAEAGESQGWMYGGAFADLDGHRWNPLFMDFTKLPK